MGDEQDVDRKAEGPARLPSADTQAREFPAPEDGARFGAPRMPGAAPSPLSVPEMSQPTIVMPPPLPPVASPAPIEPPAAADGESEREASPLAVEPPKPSADAVAPSGGAGPPSAMPPSSAAPNAMPPTTVAPMARSAAPASEQTDWDVVPVFYGTDREEEPNPNRVSYNAERGRRLELGRALVTVPKIHEVPQIERPWALRVPYFDVTIYEEAEDPKKHFTMQEIKKLSRDEFLRLVRERLEGSQRFKDHAIVFVHGYNTSFDHAVYRTAQIAYDLKFDGAAFVYSWPSGGAVASYTYDRESAGAARALSAPVPRSRRQGDRRQVDQHHRAQHGQPAAARGAEGHEVGGAARRRRSTRSSWRRPTSTPTISPTLRTSIEGFAKGVTLYAASNDRALVISRNFWQNPRAGDVLAGGPLIVPGHRYDRRHGGEHRRVRPQSLGLCGEQRPVAGHRQVDPERLAPARPAAPEHQEGDDGPRRLLALHRALMRPQAC